MPVYVQRENAEPTAEERERIDRFVAAFVAKKGGLPAGTWRVPGVGYCIFYPDSEFRASGSVG
jgi:hypothetical protein